MMSLYELNKDALILLIQTCRKDLEGELEQARKQLQCVKDVHIKFEKCSYDGCNECLLVKSGCLLVGDICYTCEVYLCKNHVVKVVSTGYQWCKTFLCDRCSKDNKVMEEWRKMEK